MKKVLFVVGPNASGKSDLGVQLAKAVGGEVISADSRQVYRRLDIGSGKITFSERQGVEHHLIDVVDPGRRYTLFEYQRDALDAVRSIADRGAPPVVVGGTGLYIDALARGYNLVDVPENLSLRAELEKQGRAELLLRLRAQDIDAASSLHGADVRRIIRAIEIVESGWSYAETRRYKPLLQPYFIGIRWERNVLRERIHQRLLRRVDGMLEEVKTLLREGVPEQFFVELGLEYRFVVRCLRGELAREQFVDQLEIAIGQFGKRQMTWFRKNPEIHWIEGGTPSDAILPRVRDFLRGSNVKNDTS